MKPQPNKFIAFSLLLFFTMVIASCSPKPTPVDVVKAYEAAYNAYHLHTLLPLLADDVKFEVTGQFSFKGKEEVRQVAEHDFALSIHMSFSGFTTSGDTVFCELTETNDWLKTAGIPEAHYTGRFVVEGGLINLIQGKLTPETDRALRQVLDPLTEWASKEKPEQLAEIMPEGKLVYNAENAMEFLALLREWKEVTESE